MDIINLYSWRCSSGTHPGPRAAQWPCSSPAAPHLALCLPTYSWKPLPQGLRGLPAWPSPARACEALSPGSGKPDWILVGSQRNLWTIPGGIWVLRSEAFLLCSGFMGSSRKLKPCVRSLSEIQWSSRPRNPHLRAWVQHWLGPGRPHSLSAPSGKGKTDHSWCFQDAGHDIGLSLKTSWLLQGPWSLKSDRN